VNVKSAWTTGALVLLVIVSLGALGFHASVGATPWSAPSSSSHLTPATCSYPALQYTDAEQGSGSAVAGPLPVTMGDHLIVVGIAFHGGVTTSPMTLSDGVNSYSNPVADVTNTVSITTTTDVWTAIASTSASLSFTVTAGNSPSYTDAIAFDVTSTAGDTVAVGTVAYGTTSVTASVSNGLCAELLAGAGSLGSSDSVTGWVQENACPTSVACSASDTQVAAGPTTSATDVVSGAGSGSSVLVLASITPAGPATATAPNSLVATPVSNTEIDLTWGNPAGESLVDNTVYLSVGAGCSSPTPIDLMSVAASYSATGLAPSTRFSFEVTASNGTGEGPATSCVMATTFGVPRAPTGVTATTEPLDIPHDYGQTLIDVAWTNPVGPLTDNHVYVYLADCATPVTSYDLGAVQVGATIGSLNPGGSYCFLISATNSTAEGAPSAPSTASIDTTLALAPTAGAAGSPTATSLSLSWTNPAESNLTGIVITGYHGSSCGGAPFDRSSVGNVSSDTAGGLSPSTTYSFTVNSTTQGGVGVASACFSGTTSALPPPPPPTPAGVSVVVEAAILGSVALLGLLVVLGSKRMR